MTATSARRHSSWLLFALLASILMLTAGCSSKRYATVGSNCYAKAVPDSGEGGLAWGDTLSMARKKSMNNCMRYASRSGGTPNTCQVVVAQCKR
ncbi:MULTISPECIES: hypothetical protein [unclassified Pseudomonas]|jgi:hypothetical protein|uniref:hypothetical protein n=1 Tax=unclassified Pseudomonas TaxID=196821 RepID=UPI000D389839|nr:MULTISPECIES: hypothetical protein [unclassified Pseudomonas]PTT28652.1 hypothetical protein DBR18_15435 [Pseudomonas sp. HMWF021]HEX4551182.1 hypothetical protein [Pseudomonas sp.]